MELLVAIVGVADVTARASTGLWKLCEQWRDAPKEIRLLRDDLVQANAFFAQIQKGLAAEQARGGQRIKMAYGVHPRVGAAPTGRQSFLEWATEVVVGDETETDFGAKKVLEDAYGTVTTDLQAMLESVDENILQAVDKVAHKNRDHFDTKLEASRIQVVDQVVTHQTPERLLRVVRHIPSDNSSRAQSIFRFVIQRDLNSLQ
ncbi:hypothetical protein CEP54_014856 [Fusarium duplospermum]|uniref:Uncharacterized protein n=1 Tax=Fusarium duplospermum TaxID=1325734 RepID=A0A428NT81_9HYPO|nr:hypothetical protein CEP54_014856 [Fusarium duplospermum]